MTNQPPFDPLNPTEEEQAAMTDGYRAAYAGVQKPAITSMAWDHGYRVGRNDRAGVADDDQRELARRAAEIRHDADEMRKRLRSGLRNPVGRFKL